MFGAEIETAIASHALAEFPREACGVVTPAGYRPLRNVAPDPEDAFDCAGELAELQVEGLEILALVHSHPHRPPERPACEGPSEEDMRQQLAMGVPWGLVLTDGVNCRPTLWWGPGVPIPPLEGRDFRHGPSGSDGRGDCYALIKDWYQLERGITLPEFPRDERWWEDRKDLYVRGFAGAGFERIGFEELQPGDVVLAHVLSDQVNHGGIYVGNGLVLHHLAGKLSRTEPIGRWRQLVTYALRHVGEGSASVG